MSLICVLMGSSGFAGPGYLARVGPPELRFAVLGPRLDPSVVLPPLDIVEPASAATNEVANGPLEQPLDVPIPDEQPPSSLAEDLLIGPPAPQVRVSEPAPPASSDEIAPQMLLQFFSKDGTPQGVVQTPVEFTPPPPSRGSTATYISR